MSILVALAKDRLGYKPQCRLSDGLTATIDWYRKKLSSETELER